MERWTPEADGDGEMKGLVVLSCERRGLSMHVLSWRTIRPGGLSSRFADLTVYSVSVQLYLECVAFWTSVDPHPWTL
jgi:hypothetical protein